MDHVRQKSSIIAAKVRKSRHKRLGKTVFLKAKKEIASKRFHQSSLFALCLYSVACDVPPGKFMFFCLSVFYKSPCKICLYVLMSSTTHFANHVFQSSFLAFCLTKKVSSD